jgi:hypothetical protein
MAISIWHVRQCRSSRLKLIVDYDINLNIKIRHRQTPAFGQLIYNDGCPLYQFMELITYSRCKIMEYVKYCKLAALTLLSSDF